MYGGPLKSGYGELGALFTASHVLPNLRRYPRWMIETESPVIALALVAPWLCAPRVRKSVAAWALLAFAAATFACYLPYVVFDAWWYLRFVLPALAVLLGTQCGRPRAPRRAAPACAARTGTRVGCRTPCRLLPRHRGTPAGVRAAAAREPLPRRRRIRRFTPAPGRGNPHRAPEWERDGSTPGDRRWCGLTSTRPGSTAHSNTCAGAAIIHFCCSRRGKSRDSGRVSANRALRTARMAADRGDRPRCADLRSRGPRAVHAGRLRSHGPLLDEALIDWQR